MVDDLHDLARVDAGEVGQEAEVEAGLVVERADDPDDVAGTDPDLRLVMALADRSGQDVAEARLETGLELAVHA